MFFAEKFVACGKQQLYIEEMLQEEHGEYVYCGEFCCLW